MEDLDKLQGARRRLFGAEAMRLVFNRDTLVPALLTLSVFIGSNFLALRHPHFAGAAPPPLFLAALLLRVLAACVLSVAILRLAVGSSRHAWMPDAAFWLFILLFTTSLALPAAVAIAIGDPLSAGTNLIMNGLAALFVSIFAPWIVAAAAERPLAWRPGPWFRRSRLWLPQRILWALLLFVPLGLLHVLLGGRLAVMDDRAWLIALADAVTAFLALMFRLGLDAAAYRRVAQG